VIVSLSLTFVAVSFALPRVSPRDNPWTRAVESLSPQTEAIFLGSSHVYCAIRPSEHANDVMTLAAPMFDYKWQERLVDLHLDRAPGTRVVVLEAGVVTLRTDTVQLYNGRNAILRDFGFDVPDASSRADEVVPMFLSSRFFRPIYYDSIRLTPNEHLAAFEIEAGYFPSRLRYDSSTAMKSLEMHIEETREEHIAANYEALARTIRKLLDRGVRVVLMRYPHHSFYRERCPPKWEEQLQASLAALREEFGDDGFDFWNLRASIRIDEDAKFRNVDHLNDLGTQELTRLIEPRLRELLDSPN
jgi:hypothetical protein